MKNFVREKQKNMKNQNCNEIYTLVLGVDEKHLQQLKIVLPSWRKHKPSLFKHPWIIFYDVGQLLSVAISEVIHQRDIDKELKIIQWPPHGIELYEGDPNNKFSNPQRYRMLSGFVHVAAKHVETPYFLKIDTDTIASDMDDWIDESLFENDPAIISQKWHYSKPANQMLELDQWAEDNKLALSSCFGNTEPLNLVPNPGSSMVKHERIISWVGFFNTEFCKLCSKVCEDTCGVGKLPVPSQDGVHFYLAKRGGFKIVRTNFKSRGWIHRSSMKGIREAVQEAMKNE